MTWFRNGHEHRNDWLRYGMMQLHDRGRLAYRQVPIGAASSDELPREIVAHEHRHTSVLAIGTGSRRRIVVLDSEDSFFWMSPIVRACDLYLCAGYNRDLFLHRRWTNPYPWLQPYQVEFYERRAAHLVEEFGSVFDRVRPLAPIMPSMGHMRELSWTARKLDNIRHRVHRSVSPDTLWRRELGEFEARFAALARLRKVPLTYDVSLADSLWGWPSHRIRLHEELRRLSGRWRINSSLSWAPPTEIDGSAAETHSPADFPMKVGRIADYEAMLAGSRLGVFATGFHWGWRSILILALYFGIPVLCDPIVLEPPFDLRSLDITESTDPGWGEVGPMLAAITDDDWRERRARNQARFDELMSPAALASSILDAYEQTAAVRAGEYA